MENQNNANVPIFSRSRDWNAQKEQQHGLNSLSNFCNNYHQRGDNLYSSQNNSNISGHQDEWDNSNEYKFASLKSGRNNYSREPYHYYGSQQRATTSSANNMFAFENYPIIHPNTSTIHSSRYHPRWNSIDNHFCSPQTSTSHQIPNVERCQNSDRNLPELNTNNRQNGCYYSNIGSNYVGNFISTKEKETQNRGKQQHKTTPQLNTSTQTIASSKHQVTRRGICFNETINKINLPSTRSSGEKLRENFHNISQTESNTLPLLRKAIQNTISRYRRDENEDKCDTKRTNTAAISTCLSKCEHVQKKYNGWYKEREDILKSNENVTSSTLRSFENEIEKTIRILSHTLDR